ncbi:Myb/SANT-like DNA-binding domain 4 [Dillenia turbinata]|uniref:Myb/SANT-like DNA-binding domain 4 n=1 Tax=Dillenia turbinata TaxID=194707 RepID=A0AAN8W262_9MAGN
MEDQYALTDLRNLITDSRPHPHFPPPPPPQPPQDHHLFHRNQHYHEMMMMGRHHIVSELINPRVEYHCDSISLTTTAPTSSPAAAVVTTAAAATSASALCGFEVEGLGGMLDGGSGRWPRQETLTLLEIRSRLDSKFKEANQKGPLWDEVSRIMCEEHGYQRSGKKCREKFENLYKYYKKTKEGKAGRQDGKHYRFFRQLEALYGETSNSVTASDTPLVVGNTFHFLSPSNNTNVAQTSHHQELEFQQVSHNNSKKHYDSPSFSNSSDYDTSNNSSEDDDRNTGGQMENDDSIDRKKKRKSTRSWKAKIKDFIDSQMKRLIERQESWLEKMLKTIERREHDRLMREEEWRKQEADRLDREHKFWANERAWIEARDAALMEALQKLTGSKDLVKNSSSSPHEVIVNEIQNLKASDQWTESAVSKLVQLRTSMDNRFQQSECSEQVLWEEIAAKMACLGYDKSGLMCKDKWESISNYLMMMRRKECNKKRKENLRSCYMENKEAFYASLNHGGPYCEINEQGPETTPRLQPSNGSSPSNSNAAGGGGGGNSVVAHDSCLRFLMGEGGNLWENTYGGVNLNKGE